MFVYTKVASINSIRTEEDGWGIGANVLLSECRNQWGGRGEQNSGNNAFVF